MLMLLAMSRKSWKVHYIVHCTVHYIVHYVVHRTVHCMASLLLEAVTWKGLEAIRRVV